MWHHVTTDMLMKMKMCRIEKKKKNDLAVTRIEAGLSLELTNKGMAAMSARRRRRSTGSTDDRQEVKRPA